MPLRIFLASLLACLSFCLPSSATAWDDASEARAEKVEGQLREELMTAVQTKSPLHGAWADLTRSENKKFVVSIIVDSEPEIGNLQEAAIERIVTKYLSPGDYTIAAIRLPFHEVLIELQEALELQPEFAGCAVEDAYYIPGPEESLFVNLIGRVADDEQRTKLIELTNQLIHRLLGPQTERVQLAKADPPAESKKGVLLLRPSEAAAAAAFELGVTAYVRREYAMAYCYFTRARVDSPVQAYIQFWRVVSLIGAGHDEKAYVILSDVLDRQHGVSAADNNILRSLERVQGPIRQRLVAMQNYFLTRCGTVPWASGPVDVSVTTSSSTVLTTTSAATISVPASSGSCRCGKR